MHKIFVLLAVCCFAAVGVVGLAAAELRITPPSVQRGKDVTLSCVYDLQGAPLYSVKWYRGRHVFYRYSPDKEPSTRIFELFGINVDLARSNQSHVVLRNVTFSLSGNFSCEVTEGPPSFHYSVATGHMEVVEKNVTEENASYVLYTTPKTFVGALEQCRQDGHELVVPETLGEAIYLQSLMQQDFVTNSFIGVHNLIIPGDFVTVEGVPISFYYQNWGISKSTIGDSRAGCVIMKDNGKMNTNNCNEKMPFICKKCFSEADCTKAKKRYLSSKHTAGTPCETHDPEYFLAENLHRCYKLHNTQINWTEAYKTCRDEGSYLVIFNSVEEVKVINEAYERRPWGMAHDQDYFLIGFHATFEEGKFMTIDGKTLEDAGYNEWAVGEPNNANGHNENCGSSYMGMRGLNDMLCSGVERFFCEREIGYL